MPDERMPHDKLPGNGRRDEPRNWTEAFAALPLETPPRDAWAQLAAELRPATGPKRNRRPLWMALAAAVALAIALPFARLPRGDETPPSVAMQPATDAPVASADKSPVDPAVESPGESPAVEPAPSPARVARTTAKPKTAPTPVAKAPANDAAALASLYTQSAQLEGLLARMRDDRVSTGPAAVLADRLETRVALIDAALAEPALDDARRTDLWRERVDALRQLAGFESTQRWLAAQGESYDAQLVAVY
ncbi:hypothetical protein GCM10027084_24660 [Pseudoxanthomonas sangjuensis]|uniref:hypothetical protein n=1 Tax=Pseudoxanthomonas sangjuensis TaxID=1503750 RepID=UPI001391719F|nr:hypothetical protein [Pseudoxanthomonas sangjuensis]